MSAVLTKPMTFAEYWPIYENRYYELIEGVPTEVAVPGSNQGHVMGNLFYEFTAYVRKHKNGRMSGGDNYVMTKRNPDTVRGADVSFYSYDRVPATRKLPEYVDAYILPELVCEINSPSNTDKFIRTKTEEYLEAGVQIVVVLDPDTLSATVHRKGELPQVFDNGDELVLPDLLPGFAVAVKVLFE